MIDPLVAPTSSWIATVDSDIAAMSDNEFAPIFAGGIVVMFGGLVSALIVGLILEKNDSYANVIADSYAQGADFDEDFWKNISDEDKVKAEEILTKLKSQGMENLPEPPKTASATPPALDTTEKEATPSPVQQQVDMFSDYDD